MKLRFFDFEVFPHWWCCTFGTLPDNIYKMEDLEENVKDFFTVVTSDERNARENLLNILMDKDYVNIGYNVKGYDLIIANAIYQGFEPEQIKIINDIIINPSMAYNSKEHLRLSYFAKKRLKNINYQDLLDDGTGSLKEKEAVLGLNILESSVDFDKEDLTDEDKKEVIYYNKHDVYSSMKFYLKIVAPYTKTKLAMGKAFNIPENVCRESTNAKLVSLALNAKRSSFPDENKIEISLPDKIIQYCYDNIPFKVLDRLLKNNEAFETKLFNNYVSYGNGGIHSVYLNTLYVESNSDWVLLNVDATSYYPSILIQFDCLSRAIDDKSNFEYIYNRRVEIKHKQNKTEEDEEYQRAYKLVLNTTFGASGNKYLELYDPHMCSRCCRLGQIFLTALACKINNTLNGAKIIQSNTDGILVYLRRNDIPLLKNLMDEWTNISGINMETEEYSRIWQRDVNNYVMISLDRTLKSKGSWLNCSYERPGYVMVGPLTAFVSAKAATDYLVHRKDIVRSIVENNNIFDFAITCKKGPSFRGVVQKFTDGTEKELFKCNRVIASKDSSLGYIYKTKMYKGKLSYYKMPNIPEHCKLINEDLSTYNFNELKKELDYMYYINRAIDLLNIDWYQLDGTDLYKTNKFNYII